MIIMINAQTNLDSRNDRAITMLNHEIFLQGTKPIKLQLSLESVQSYRILQRDALIIWYNMLQFQAKPMLYVAFIGYDMTCIFI